MNLLYIVWTSLVVQTDKKNMGVGWNRAEVCIEALVSIALP